MSRMAALNNKIIPIEISMRSLKSEAAGPRGRRYSISTRSSSTFSQNDLNEAIMNMLHSAPNQRCRRICVGNPITVIGQRKQMAKMLAVVLLPLLILTIITAVDFSKSLTSYINTYAIAEQIDFGVKLGGFLLALQKERDMSSLYLSQIGLDSKRELLLAYPETDGALDNLSSWPVSPSNKQKQYQSREHFVNFLNRHRYELDSNNATATAEINFYSQTIEIFIKWMYDSVSELDTGTIWKTLVGYQELIIASEYIGRERGYGIYYYATGAFMDRKHYLLFMESQDSARTHFASARMYSVTASDIYHTTLDAQNQTLRVINDFREDIKANNSSVSEGSLEKAKRWYANMSIYMDVMKSAQKMLTAKINGLLKNNSNADMKEMIIAGVIFSGIVIISPLIIMFVYKLTSNIQKYSSNIAKKTKAVNREKKQSEAVLFQMLPRTVAEDLKQKGSFNAEHFTECTIFQSDMVGFTQLSSNSSPFQVTDMLNTLFSCFDDRISIYDTYKVETVGDGYMVVSGVPRRNGVRHASEIATLSLDLLYHVNKLELPHLSGERYKLRIGCHSGPVVAGVVGSKNPRYCLFGSTVRIAALMESSGETNKIQISHSSYSLLSAIGGFEMEERQTMTVFAKDELKKHNCPETTYWLIQKDYQVWEGYSTTSDASFGSSL
ncbi:uncharacterized protein LOC143056978 [Mytilus galloprovincialis]|uniref:uncharacterized protein LOC143056978 n=1 Tax=Mytilus galloprovincialis TaxID=29158 RepID=UPI003F7B4B5E